MNINKLITTAMITLGVVSAASASSTSTVGGLTGTSYTVVYITGSTAFNSVLQGVLESTNVFSDYTSAHVQGSGNTTYNVYGTLAAGAGAQAGQPYVISVSLTGSEAGLWALEENASGCVNPNNISGIAGGSASAVLPGTPKPNNYLSPVDGVTPVAAYPDLSLADTSQAVSLSPTPALPDYGIVAAIPFGWFKGAFTAASADSSWKDLVNVTENQLKILVGTTPKASFFTGNTNDVDKVYLVGRNKGSGTRVNTLLDINWPVTQSIGQYAAANATNTSASVLTFNGSASTLVGAGGLALINNDGFDAGSGVTSTLKLDITGSSDASGHPTITLGYVGLSSLDNVNTNTIGGTAANGGAVLLSLNGVPASDASIITGSYSFWGHEHLYGQVGQAQTTASPGFVIGNLLSGNTAATPNETLGSSATAGGAIEAWLQSYPTKYGNESAKTTTASPVLEPKVMLADKPSGSDSGYPSQL